MLARLHLLGVLFNDVCKPAHAEAVAVLLFQLLVHNLITPLNNPYDFNFSKQVLRVFDAFRTIVQYNNIE